MWNGLAEVEVTMFLNIFTNRILMLSNLLNIGQHLITNPESAKTYTDYTVLLLVKPDRHFI